MNINFQKFYREIQANINVYILFYITGLSIPTVQLCLFPSNVLWPAYVSAHRNK